MLRIIAAIAAFGLSLLGTSYAAEPTNAAHAGTAKFAGSKVERHRRICYYEFDGFTYHYTITNQTIGAFVTTCADSLEVPFHSRGRSWAVLIHDELEVHDWPKRICYYGMDSHLFVVPIDRYATCNWVIEKDPIHESGIATRIEEKRRVETATKICIYELDAKFGTSKYYKAISVYSDCPPTMRVS